MTENSLHYVVSVLKGENPKTVTDWYETTGFLCCHKIAGLFYNRAKKSRIELPSKIEKFLSETFERQIRRTQSMRAAIGEISRVLAADGAEHILLKGSVLCNVAEEESAIYEDGERISNDIDILVEQDGITAVENSLKKLGFVQGRYAPEEKKIKPFPRLEILKRRMNRGETAPFLKTTGNPELPFIEADINFSLGNVPGERDSLLSEMIATRKEYAGKVPMYVANEEMFFLHLILHQYKESCLYFMAERRKDLDLYKLADIYYLWKKDSFDKGDLKKLAFKYGVQKEIGTVLGQTGRIFEDEELKSAAEEYGERQPEVIDYEGKKRLLWTADERTRICSLDPLRFLKERKEDDH